nr:CNNM domain-containing protein [bacterium]
MSVLEFLILFLLSLLGAVFFAGSETGILAADTMRLRRWSEKGSRGARSVLRMLDQKDTIIATLLVGNNLAVVSASALATSFFTRHFGQNGAALSILIVSPMMLVFGEILPKAVYLSFGNRLLVMTHWLISFFIICFKPLSVTTMLFPKMMVRGTVDWTPGLTRDDIRVLVKTSDMAGDLAREERMMISRLLELKDRRVSRAMVPVIETAMIADTAKIRDAHTVIRKRGVSRLPIYSERNDNIVGIVFATDLLRSTDPLESIMVYSRKPVFVPEQKTIIELFREFYRKLEIAIVVDEYGM